MLRHGRLRVRKFQEYVCKNYLRKWFDISINDIAYLLFVFFGHGIKLAYPLTFKGNKKNLVCFIKFLNRDKGDSDVWNYFRENIVDINGKPVLAINPASNIKDYYSFSEQLRSDLKELWGDKPFPEEWIKDLE